MAENVVKRSTVVTVNNSITIPWGVMREWLADVYHITEEGNPNNVDIFSDSIIEGSEPMIQIIFRNKEEK